jgi:Protein of unknown function (DUF3558)
MTQPHQRLTALTSLTLLLTVAGCALPPLPIPAAGPPPPTTESAAPTSSPFPPRPAELRLDGVDPCQLLTQTQQSALNIQEDTSGQNNDGLGSLDCVWNTPVGIHPAPSDTWVARTVLKQGAAGALGNQVQDQIVQIDGYSAVQTYAPGFDLNNDCVLVIDVAQGQSLQVRYDSYGTYPGMKRQLACQLDRKAATLMMQNLHTLAH